MKYILYVLITIGMYAYMDMNRKDIPTKVQIYLSVFWPASAGYLLAQKLDGQNILIIPE